MLAAVYFSERLWTSLRHQLRHGDPDVVDRLFSSDAADLVTIVPELAERGLPFNVKPELGGGARIREGDIAALQFALRWKDAESGEPCLCFQSHFFELEDEQIRLHRMYCAGVRVLQDGDSVRPV